MGSESCYDRFAAKPEPSASAIARALRPTLFGKVAQHVGTVGLAARQAPPTGDGLCARPMRRGAPAAASGRVDTVPDSARRIG